MGTISVRLIRSKGIWISAGKGFSGWARALLQRWLGNGKLNLRESRAPRCEKWRRERQEEGLAVSG